MTADCSQGNRYDFSRQDKVCADRAFDLVFLNRFQIGVGIFEGVVELFLVLLIFLPVQEPVRNFFKPLKAEKGATQHQ